jgi:3,4-dihydroxy 2-butanone 4-phosphate synthase / GTP cyclohydrolase II
MSLQASEFIKYFRSRQLGLITDTTAEKKRGVLVSSAAHATGERVNEMLTLGKGLVLVALPPEKAYAFGLHPMQNIGMNIPDNYNTSLAMLTSVEAREGVTTGISAADRATTIRIFGGDSPHPRDIVKPGHIFPILTKKGGVLVRQAFPEGALDIVTLSDLGDAAVFTDVLNSSGEFSTLSELQTLATTHKIPSIELEEITRYQLSRQTLIKLVAEARLPTQMAGEMKMYIFQSQIHNGEHAALVKGEIDPCKPVLTRVQAEQTFSDVFGSTHTSSRKQIEAALTAIGKRNNGVLVYLRRPNVGELAEQIQGTEVDTAQKGQIMMRQYGVGAQILRFLGARELILLTTNPKRYQGIEAFDLTVKEQVPLFP